MLPKPRSPQARGSGPTGAENRPPPSRERKSGRPWEASYLEGPAPWDIGRPQPAVERLAAEGRFDEPVLDVGCGTGENTLYLAGRGLGVLGVDIAPTALALARAKAQSRGVPARFAPADALRLQRLRRRFRTVLDCGLFHGFDDSERGTYAASLAAATESGGTLFVLCFSGEGPDTGPHPVGREELAAVFGAAAGWQVGSVEPERLQTRFHGPDGAPAWLLSATRR
jgi:SAM-dependent methyltransferase